jgi:hypothetical protein
MLEVGVTREQFCAGADCRGRDQRIDRSDGQSGLPTRIHDLRRANMIVLVSEQGGEQRQVRAKLIELTFGPNAGKELLKHYARERHW